MRKALIGPSVRCENDRAREHERTLGHSDSNTTLTEHWRNCRKGWCRPRLNEIEILGRGSSDVARDIMEAFFIKKGHNCVSDTSLALYKSESDLIKSFL